MIRRLLILVLLVASVLWWMRRLTAGARPRVRAQEPRNEPARDLGPMVRDRVCNTFLPKSRALSARVGSEEYFFCSERCRDAFYAAREAKTG